jgi:hypothetical protein
MKYIIVWIIILSAINPAQAYGSGNTIYVKRERPSKPSLLDRKFVIRTVASDIRTEESPTTNLTAMHQQLAAKPAAVKTRPSSVKAKPQTVSSNNWNDFATEAEWTDSRDVSAKLIF